MILMKWRDWKCLCKIRIVFTYGKFSHAEKKIAQFDKNKAFYLLPTGSVHVNSPMRAQLWRSWPWWQGGHRIEKQCVQVVLKSQCWVCMLIYPLRWATRNKSVSSSVLMCKNNSSYFIELWLGFHCIKLCCFWHMETITDTLPEDEYW